MWVVTSELSRKGGASRPIRRTALAGLIAGLLISSPSVLAASYSVKVLCQIKPRQIHLKDNCLCLA
ncbi:hypothetical protein MTQ28_23855 [Escherichia coli]|nr:hypothetical protein [Escherichia coli]